MIDMNALAVSLSSSQIPVEKARESMRLLAEAVANLTDDQEMREMFQGLIMVIVAASFQQGYARGHECHHE